MSTDVSPQTDPAESSVAPFAIAPALSVLGLGVAGLGLFALPMQNFSFPVQDTSFQQLREVAAFFGQRHLPGRSRGLVSGLAEFWWRYGLMTAAVLMILLVTALAFDRAADQMGWAIAGLALLTIVLHAFALAQTANLLDYQQKFRASGSLYDNAGSGTWVSFAGLALLVSGGLVAALSRRAKASTRQATASPSA